MRAYFLPAAESAFAGGVVERSIWARHWSWPAFAVGILVAWVLLRRRAARSAAKAHATAVSSSVAEAKAHLQAKLSATAVGNVVHVDVAKQAIGPGAELLSEPDWSDWFDQVEQLSNDSVKKQLGLPIDVYELPEVVEKETA